MPELEAGLVQRLVLTHLSVGEREWDNDVHQDIEEAIPPDRYRRAQEPPGQCCTRTSRSDPIDAFLQEAPLAEGDDRCQREKAAKRVVGGAYPAQVPAWRGGHEISTAARPLGLDGLPGGRLKPYQAAFPIGKREEAARAEEKGGCDRETLLVRGVEERPFDPFEWEVFGHGSHAVTIAVVTQSVSQEPVQRLARRLAYETGVNAGDLIAEALIARRFEHAVQRLGLAGDEFRRAVLETERTEGASSR